MDVINKLYSSVSNTVSQLSSVLPGNPITKEFDIGEHIGSAGPGIVKVHLRINCQNVITHFFSPTSNV